MERAGSPRCTCRETCRRYSPKGGRLPAEHDRPDRRGPPDGRGRADGRAPQEAIHKIVVPADVAMVSLLGARDELLRAVERAFPRADVHVRGNEVTITGPHGEVALVERLIDELLAVLASGQPLSPDAVERAVGMLRQQTTERPADVLTLNIISSRGPHDPAEDPQPEAVRRRDRRAHDRLRDRPGRYRQDLSRDGQGGAGAAGQAGQPDHPDPAGGRGGRAARLPPRHAEREDRPVPAAACTTPCTTWSTPSRSRG